MKARPPYSKASKDHDRWCRAQLGLIGNRPWSRYLLGRIEARMDFSAGRDIVLNATDVQSRYFPNRQTRFYHRAEEPGPNTLYRIRVKKK